MLNSNPIHNWSIFRSDFEEEMSVSSFIFLKVEEGKLRGFSFCFCCCRSHVLNISQLESSTWTQTFQIKNVRKWAPGCKSPLSVLEHHDQWWKKEKQGNNESTSILHSTGGRVLKIEKMLLSMSTVTHANGHEYWLENTSLSTFWPYLSSVLSTEGKEKKTILGECSTFITHTHSPLSDGKEPPHFYKTYLKNGP